MWCLNYPVFTLVWGGGGMIFASPMYIARHWIQGGANQDTQGSLNFEPRDFRPKNWMWLCKRTNKSINTNTNPSSLHFISPQNHLYSPQYPKLWSMYREPTKRSESAVLLQGHLFLKSRGTRTTLQYPPPITSPKTKLPASLWLISFRLLSRHSIHVLLETSIKMKWRQVPS